MNRLLLIFAFAIGLACTGAGFAVSAAGEAPVEATAEICHVENADGGLKSHNAEPRCRRLGDLTAVSPSCPSQMAIVTKARPVSQSRPETPVRPWLANWTIGPVPGVDPPPPKFQSRTH